MGLFDFTKKPKTASCTAAAPPLDLGRMSIDEALSTGKMIQDDSGRYLNLTLKEYGNFAAQWSLELTNGMFDTISKLHCCEMDGYTSLISSIDKGRLNGTIIFMGLYSASYYVYASHLLFRSEVGYIGDLTSGFIEGFSVMKTPYPDKGQATAWLANSFLKFADAIELDYIFHKGEGERDKVYKTALVFFNQAYTPTNEFSFLEHFLLQPLIQFAPIQLFEITKDRIVRVNDHIRVRVSG